MKYSIKNYFMNLPLNALLFFQMLVLLGVLTYSAYTFHSKYKYFVVFEEELSGEGVVFNAETLVCDGGFVTDTAIVTELYKLESVKAIMGSYTVFAESPYENSKIWAYDKSIIEKFVPDIAEGHWLNKYTKEEGYLNVVVTQNEYGIKIGDIFEIKDNENTYQVKVVGVLDENAAIFNKSTNGAYEENYKDLFWNYSASFEGDMIIFMNRQELYETELVCMLTKTFLLCYEDDITSEEKRENYNKLCMESPVIYTTEFSIMYEESWGILSIELMTFLPIGILLLIITIFTALHISHINLMKGLRKFAIYFMMGCSWVKCKKTSILSSIWSLIMAILLNYVIWFYLMYSDIIAYDEKFITYINIICIVIFILYVLLVGVYQEILLRKFTPYQIMRGDNDD